MLDTLPPIALAGIAIIIGFAGLIWSADRFVAGAASIAEAFGIAPVIIGLTIVSFGTSAPEVMVSLIAAINGTGELAIGNALGSNIANVGLVLGATTLVCAIPVQLHLLKQESGVLIGVTLFSGYCLYDAQVSPLEGWLLLALILPVMWYLTVTKQKLHNASNEGEDAIPHYTPKVASMWFAIGLIILMISSKMLVWGAETTALYFNVSPLIIGLTVVAIGTSLPELAASIMSALKGHHDIAVGNIIGSNIFNLLAVMSIPGIFSVERMEQTVFTRDYMSMLAITVLLVVGIAFTLFRSGADAKLGKVFGVILLGFYIGYMYLIGTSQFIA